jgi:hypothetical protein
MVLAESRLAWSHVAADEGVAALTGPDARPITNKSPDTHARNTRMRRTYHDLPW